MSDAGLLLRREDWHCVLYHAMVVAAFVVAFALWLNPELSGIDGPWKRALFAATAAPLLGWIAGIDIGVNYHNHAHRPMFTRPLLNRWFERLWTPFCAWPAKYWAHYHVAVHHARLMQPGPGGDWTVRQKKADGTYESCLRYQLRVWPWRSLKNFPRELRDGHFDKRTAAVELAWFLLLYSIPFALDPVMGLALWLLPHWCGNCITMGRGMYIQHADCEAWLEDKSQPHSANFPTPAFNLTMFNIGFHTEHHNVPGLHWSELPALAMSLPTSADETRK